jgi:type I restriction enzyme R subunit
MGEVEKSVNTMLRPAMVLDLLANFTAFATQKGKQRIKIIARYQQVDGVNKIVERVVAAQVRKGLIWHFQGSGKSLLMLFAARKLRLHPALKNPTVLVVVDRIDLDSQIAGTFYAADMANLVRTDSRKTVRPAGQGRAQIRHHHDPQVRRGGRRAERPRQHHRHG